MEVALCAGRCGRLPCNVFNLFFHTGPLRINASDLMQAYEDRLKGQELGAVAVKAPPPAPAPAQGFPQQSSSRAVGGGGGGASIWNAPAASAWGGGGAGAGFAGGLSSGGSRDGLTKEELAKLARLEQERRDEEFARQLAKQEQYEASNAFYIQQAQQRKRQAGGTASATTGGGSGAGYGDSNFLFEAGPPLGGSGYGGGMGGGASGRSGTLGGTQLLGGTADIDRFQQRPTLMDHLPSQLRGDEPKFEPQ